MTNKLIVPTETQDGITAKIAEHFGRAPFFTVIDLDDKGEVANVSSVKNVSEHVGGTGSPHDYIIKLQPKALIAHGMGPRGIIAFRNAGIEVLKVEGRTVQDVVEAYTQGKLQELTDGCPHAHHHHAH